MEELIKLLKESPNEAIASLTAGEKDPQKIKDIRNEFSELDRNTRETQIGQVQKDKKIGEGEKTKTVKGVRIPIPIQNKIVNTATAFEVGEPVTLIPDITDSEDNENKLTQEIERLWKVNRIDNIIQKAIRLQKSELQCAVLFYMKDLGPESLINRLLGINPKKEIKIKLLENKSGRMAPFFDPFGDMTAFTWSFDTTEDKKTVKNVWVYTDEKVFKLSNKSGAMTLESSEDHGFSKIPVVYFSQDKPEWFIAEPMIDRLEVALSKLGASNDYSGHPILKIYGEIIGGPDKDEDGKSLRFKQKVDEDSGKVTNGDADFLTHDNAPESVKMELDRLEKYIYSLTSTPDISFDNVKGLGSISGIAIKLMFLDAMMKAKMNEGDNRTSLERIINILISGVITTTGRKLKSEAQKTFFEVQFNSILPDDLKESVETFARAVDAGIMSVQTAVEGLDMTGDAKQELENILKDKAAKEPDPAKEKKLNPEPII